MPFANVNGIRLHYRAHGKGEPLVLVAGWGTDLRAWVFQLLSFRRYFRVVAFDNRGVGRSDTPAGPYSIRQMAADVVGLMDHLHIAAAHVLGLSMGGMIAQEVAINHPHRVLKLVLGCTFAWRGEGSGQTEEYLAEIRGDVTRAKLALASLANNNRLGRVFVHLWMRLMSRSWAAGFESQGAAIRCHDTRDRLHLITASTLVIAGTRDRVILPRSSELLASRIPGARLVMIENGSHSMSAENRKDFNGAVLSFLRGN